MNFAEITSIFEAMYSAGHIARIVPELPNYIERGQADVLLALYNLSGNNRRVKVTDISKHKRVSSPGTIRLIKSCEHSGFLTKSRDETDKRIVYMTLTEKGKMAVESFFGPYMQLVGSKLAEKYTDAELLKFVEMIYDVHTALSAATKEFDTARNNGTEQGAFPCSK